MKRRPLVVLMLACLAAPVAAQQFAAVDSIVLRGIRRGVYPGAVVVIGNRDGIIRARGYGHLTWSARSPRPSPDSTLFDLASLTKVVATTGAAMRLVERGTLELDAPVMRYLPQYHGDGRERITIRMLLEHTSGLRPFLPFYRAPDRDGAVALLYAERPSRAPGQTVEYSDLNAILLGLVVEQVSGEPLDRFVKQEVFAPLGMDLTGYHPTGRQARLAAPSVIHRGQPVPGKASDPNVERFGGVAGHAGLFSTGADLARYAETWLRRGISPDGATFVQPETVADFLTPGEMPGGRPLGWDRPDRSADDPGTFGLLVSETTYGHTGWTGTQLWIDPARGLYVVFLTNRSFEPRSRRSMAALKDVRAELADTIVRSVGM